MSSKITIPIIIALAVVVLVAGFYTYSLSEQNAELKKIIIYTNDLGNSEDGLLADEYYSYASISYDLDDYSGVITNCLKSREYASSHTQNLRDENALLLNEELQFFQTWIELNKEEIKIYENLYEACEYFESAARNYDNGNYEMGGENIDGHNEKIRAHDDAVRRYNDILATFSLQVNQYLENL